MSEQIRLPTLSDLILWATEKPHETPIGKIKSACACPLVHYMTETYPGYSEWQVSSGYISAYTPSYSLEMNAPLYDVITLVDKYPFATKDDEFPGHITASAFLHILQEVRRVYEEQERRGENER